MSENKVLEIKNLVKTYGTKGFQTKVLKGLNLTVNKHDFICDYGSKWIWKNNTFKYLIYY